MCSTLHILGTVSPLHDGNTIIFIFDPVALVKQRDKALGSVRLFLRSPVLTIWAAVDNRGSACSVQQDVIIKFGAK